MITMGDAVDQGLVVNGLWSLASDPQVTPSNYEHGLSPGVTRRGVKTSRAVGRSLPLKLISAYLSEILEKLLRPWIRA
jgi:hypothetical protein